MESPLRRERQQQDSPPATRKRFKSRKAVEAEESARAEEAEAAGRRAKVAKKDCDIKAEIKTSASPAPAVLAFGKTDDLTINADDTAPPVLVTEAGPIMYGPTIRVLLLKLLCDTRVRRGVNIWRLSQAACWMYCLQMLLPDDPALVVPDLKDFDAKNDATRVIQWIVKRYTGSEVSAVDVTSKDVTVDASDEGAKFLFFLPKGKGQIDYKITKYFRTLLAGKPWPPSPPQTENASGNSAALKVLKPLTPSELALANEIHGAVKRPAKTAEQRARLKAQSEIRSRAGKAAKAKRGTIVCEEPLKSGRSRKRKAIVGKLEFSGGVSGKNGPVAAAALGSPSLSSGEKKLIVHDAASCESDSSYGTHFRFDALVEVAVGRIAQSLMASESDEVSTPSPASANAQYAVAELLDCATTPVYFVPRAGVTSG